MPSRRRWLLVINNPFVLDARSAGRDPSAIEEVTS